MSLYEFNEKIKIARRNGFKIIQINFFEIFSNLSQIYIHYYLKLRIPVMHRQFFKLISQNPLYVQTHCNDSRNLFHFACRKYLYNNPQF